MGQNASGDKTPFDTFAREVREELCFDNSIIDPIELNQLFGIKTLDVGQLKTGVEPTNKIKTISSWL